MQIDFHHGVTYVIARLAGFKHKEASIVAHCAQYVDDATNGGQIKFDNNAMYKRIYSAHKHVDYRHLHELSNHQVWIPFHFLPGNNHKPAGENPDGTFIQKLICCPNSFVAKDMVRKCIKGKKEEYGLHRLGITMHVYADTWAHQGFAGVNHKVNNITDIKDKNGVLDPSIIESVANYFGDGWDSIQSKFVGSALPLGHGAALSYPDMPYLKWSYVDGLGNTIERDNPKDFLEAADNMCIAMKCYINGNYDSNNIGGLPKDDKDKIASMFNDIDDKDGDQRHNRWLDAIKKGAFSFGAEESVDYIAKGENSWKDIAIGTKKSKDTGEETFTYNPAFLKSDWKLFHDALQAHRFCVLHDILPKYGICAA